LWVLLNHRYAVGDFDFTGFRGCETTPTATLKHRYAMKKLSASEGSRSSRQTPNVFCGHSAFLMELLTSLRTRLKPQNQKKRSG
jgi:hypothetical protein